VLQRNRAGHYLADGHINGRPVRFLLDTGATHVALSADLARQLDLELGASSLSRTANGLVKTRSARLQRVDVSGIELYDIRASVLPNMVGDEVLLGMSFLKHLQLIQSGDQLLLRQE
jgi:aspartyl protease family protein